MHLQVNQEKLNQRMKKVLDHILEGKAFPKEEIEHLGGLALLSADTDKIKEYVFETAKLPEIRGASMILDSLNRGRPEDEGESIRRLFANRGLPVSQEDDEAGHSCVIYAGGGSLLALVPRDLAEELKHEIEALYPRETGIATITCTWRPVTNDEIQHGLSGYNLERLLALRELLIPQEWRRIAAYYHGSDEDGDRITQDQFNRRKNFSELMALQGIKLRQGKESKVKVPFIESVPYARRCEACGTKPAAKYLPNPDPRYLCSTCVHKFGVDERGERKGRWTQQFEEFWAEQGVQVIAETPPDLETIAQASIGRARNYVGFIYADGNDVGKAVESAPSLKAYRKNSSVLEQTVEEVTYLALCRHLVEKAGQQPVRVRPFEIITIGGDDLLLIVPGDAALLIARDICREFEQQLPKSGFESSGKPTMSAGVVIAESHTPIYFLHDLADQLLKSAKKRARELESREGTIDFLVLKSQTTLANSLSHLRSTPPLLLTNSQLKEKLFLTGRPYTLTQMDSLIQSAQNLQGFPGSQLQGYRRVLRQGRFHALIHFLYQYARAKHQKSILQQVFDRWQMRLAPNISPWLPLAPKRGFNCYWTPWWDIIEILDFVPRLTSQSDGGESLEGSY